MSAASAWKISRWRHYPSFPWWIAVLTACVHLMVLAIPWIIHDPTHYEHHGYGRYAANVTAGLFMLLIMVRIVTALYHPRPELGAAIFLALIVAFAVFQLWQAKASQKHHLLLQAQKHERQHRDNLSSRGL